MVSRLALLSLVVAVLGVACTSALAPENKRSEPLGSDQLAGQAPASPVGPENPAAPGGDDGGTADGATDGSADGADGLDGVGDGGAQDGEVLGTIEAEVTDLGFAAKSTYALSLSDNGMLAITVLDVEVRDSMFKQVESWECKPCNGADDERCKTDGETAKTVSITFMKSFTGDAGHKVDPQGFPKEDANRVTGNFMDDMLAGLSLANSINPAATPNSGSVDFTAGKRPAAVGDEYEAQVDLTFGDGKKYAATIRGRVWELPTQPTPPTCEADEYVEATYE